MRFRDMSASRLLALIVAVLGLALAVACNSSTPTSSTGTTGGTGGTGTGSGTANVMITINGMQGANSYSPNPAAVKVGQTVSWHNADAIAHTATGTGFDTGSIAPGATSAPMAFNTAGTLSYHCSFHPSMVGTLNVQ